MSRVKKITLNAMELYCERVEHFYAQLNQFWASHLENVQTQIQQIANESDARSHKSEYFNESVSVRTSSTMASSGVARKHAKAEAAKAKAVFAQQEAALRKQRTQLEERQFIAQAATARQKADV